MFNPRLHNDPMNDLYNPLQDKWEPFRRQARSGANGFFAIAILSIVNSYFLFKGIPLRFIAGLGLTQFVDGLAFWLMLQIGAAGIAVGLAINILIAGVFALFGWFARKFRPWSFLVGMVVYVMDAGLVLWFQDFWGVGFHVIVLFFIYKGFRAVKQLP